MALPNPLQVQVIVLKVISVRKVTKVGCLYGVSMWPEG